MNWFGSRTKIIRPGWLTLGTAILLLLLLAVIRSQSRAPVLVSAAAEGTPERSLHERLAARSVGAHRGGSWHLDNNTLHRFEAARNAGVDIIETDIRLTADGVPVVYHDQSVPRLLAKDPLVSSLTLEQLRALQVFPRQIPPTFEEVLEWSAGRVVINAEFKEPEVIDAAVSLVQKHSAHEWVYFQCKSDQERYRRARSLDSRVALLFKPADEEMLNWALSLEDDRLVVIEFGNDLFRPELVRKAQAAGKLVSFNSWRLSPLAEFFGANCTEVWEMGADICITKRPKSAVIQRARYAAAAREQE